MKSFQKGLLLGIGMVVACGTFVASTSVDKDTYTISKLTDDYQRDQIEFTTYEKVMNGENSNFEYKVKSVETFRVHRKNHMVKISDMKVELLKDQSYYTERSAKWADTGVETEKMYLGPDCYQIKIEFQHSDLRGSGETTITNGKGEKLERRDDCEPYDWINL